MIKHFGGGETLYWYFKTFQKETYLTFSHIFSDAFWEEASVMKASHMLVYLSVEPPFNFIAFLSGVVVNRIQGHFGQLAFSDEMV